jgi:SAM-dependent methyltransferase
LDIAHESSPNYHQWIAQLCRPYIGSRVLEIGAGHGAVTRFLCENVSDYVATDTDPECLAALEERFGASESVSVRKFDVLVDTLEAPFDTIIMINVLEHLLDDAGILNSLSQNLTPEGNLVIYVPAFNFLYGDWDDRVGHFRRYSKPQLERVMKEGELVIAESRYVNLVALPAWFVFSRLKVRNKQSRPGGNLGRDLRVWDNTAIPVTRWIESRLRPPVGLNVLGVGRRPAADGGRVDRRKDDA